MSIKVEDLTFDEAIERLENILDKLNDTRNEESSSMSDKEIEEQLNEAELLKNHCKKLLDKEKEDIIKTAKENNIPLEDIGLDEKSLDLDLDMELDEEE
jgi:deoxyhypusine synthase